jgi:hypothetical protein
MCEVLSAKKGPDYSIVQIKNGKSIKRIIAIHGTKSDTEGMLKGKFNVKLGSPIKETTMNNSYPEVIEAINNRRTSVFRFIDNMGRLN